MIILFNANIYSPIKNKTKSAIVIKDNKILAIGSTIEILEQYGHHSKKIDLEGGTILPGLTDSHLHLVHLALSITSVNCETSSIKECLQNVLEKAQYFDDDRWIEGHGWNHNVWENAAYGTASQLDTYSKNHPVLLHAKSLHAAWANSKALEIAGISSNTPDPEGGEILRDGSGNPTGILLENAVSLVSKVIPSPTPEKLANDILAVQSKLWSMGITGVHDFDGIDSFIALQMLQEERKLGLRVNKNMPIASLPNLIDSGLRSGFGNSMLYLGHLKMFADGALGPQSAAMVDVYEGSNSKGILLLSREEVFETGITAAENGWGLSIHAIGDLANQTVLDGISDIRKYETQHDLKHFTHRIEHVQIITPKDQKRLVMLDVVASIQPIHCTSDMEIVDKYWGSRGENAYAFHNLVDFGTEVVFGSDAPVESPNPFFGLHAAVTRRRQNGYPGEDGWYSKQKINLEESLACYTLAPAALVGMETQLGKTAPGYLADLIVLREDPFQCDPQLLYNLKPCMTFVDGNIVYKE